MSATPTDFETYIDAYGVSWNVYNFTSYSNTNYISITFEDGLHYLKDNGLINIQLEEGSIFTGYEEYVEGVLVDTSAPYFQNAGKIVSYYDSPITIAEIQQSLTAYDAIDGNVTNNITLVSDNYTQNISVLGLYECVFSVSDQAGNTSEVTVFVELADVLAPVFSNVPVVQAVYPNVYTVENIKGMMSASDNYDGDISSQIVLINDNYTDNASVVGNYSMEFQVTDSSGNSENYIQQIMVVDNEYPIISGINNISVGYDRELSVSEVMGYLSYTDNYDIESSLELVLETNTYTNNSRVLGNYEMSFSVTDSSNNKTIHRVDINVVDEIGPIVYFNSSIIQTYTDTVMSLPDFTKLLVNTKEINPELSYYVTVRYDSYSKNANTPGIYHLKLNLKNEQGDELTKDLEIRVVERPIDFIVVPSNPEEDVTVYTYQLQTYIIGGVLTVLLVVSNIVWVVISKKK